MGRGVQFRLLLWKNYMLQRRKVLVTCFEIGLPALFAIILILVRLRTDFSNVSSPTIWNEFNVNSTLLSGYPPFNWKLQSWIISYTPNSSAVNNVMVMTMNHLNSMCQPTCIIGLNGFPDEDSMVKEFLNTSHGNNSSKVHSLAGVVFSKFPVDSSKWSNETSVEYKLRFPFTLRCEGKGSSTNPLKNQDHWLTQLMFPKLQQVRPRSHSATQGGAPCYLEEGFLALQYSIDMSILELTSNHTFSAGDVSLSLCRFPYPPYVDDNFVLVIQQQLPFVIMLSFVFSSMQIVKDLVYEKEQKLKESMKMMGLSNWLHWTAWFVKYFLFLIVTVAIETVLFIINTGKNGSIIGYTSGGVIFIFLLAYTLATISFCFAVSTFFSRANSAAAAGGILFFVTYIPYFFLQQRYYLLSWPVKIFCCLISNVAMAFGGQVIGMFEGTGVGVQFSNLNKPASIDDDFTMLNVILMLLLDAVIYAVITWYVEAVHPGEYGIPRPYYFPLQTSYWCGTAGLVTTSGVNSHSNLNSSSPDGPDVDEDESLLVPSDELIRLQASPSHQLTTVSSAEVFEAEPEGLHAGISIQNLRKEFGSGSTLKVAVCNMSLDMYEGQITALLGHNGAGKTTTMSILTGFFPPTSGTAFVNGYDVVQDIDNVRSSLGLCPQHNVLFDELTVEEHLMFFTKLKGFPAELVDEEVNRMVKDVGLEAKKKVLVKTLSGGMKRKLSVGIALTGGSKVVILDEPTSGMDPDARRQTWDLLQRHRSGRTLVLSTHFMDEADLLGDRIAIMASGVVQCCGSPLFLKNKYGAGYHMAIVKETTCSVESVTRIVQSHVPGARLESDVSAELSYVLPQESKGNFSALFTELDRNLGTLGISSYGASVTTMEEVFIKVGEQAVNIYTEDPLGAVSHQQSGYSERRTGLNLESDDECILLEPGKNVGLRLFLQQFVAMFVKRMHHSSRSGLLNLSQLLVPIVFTILALIVIKTLPGPEDSPPLDLNLSKLPGSVVVYSSGFNESGHNVAAAYASVLQRDFPSTHLKYINNASAKYAADPNITDYLIGEGHNSIGAYNNLYAIALDVSESTDEAITNTKATVLFNNQGYHAQAISLNAFTNALLYQKLGFTRSAIVATNHPMPRTVDETVSDEIQQGFQGFAIAVNMLFGMSFLSASFVVFLVRERAVKAKHCQFVSGVSAVTFWSATFVWDFINYIVPCILIIAAFRAFNVVPLWADGRFMDIFLLMILYAWAMLPFMYLLSFIFTVPSTSLVWLTMFNIISGIATLLAVTILSIPQLGSQNLAHILEWVFLTILPNFCLGQGFVDFYSNYEFTNICKPVINFCFLIPGPNPCCKGKCGDFCIDFTDDYLSLESGGIGRHLIFLGAQGVFYFVCIAVIESRVFDRLGWITCHKQSHLSRAESLVIDEDDLAATVCEDDDVLAEQSRIAMTPMSDLMITDSVILHSLSKTYGNGGSEIVAVDRLSFGVRRGECFGLLGINGAGKTTTFQILTGDEMPSSGEAYINGFGVRQDMNKVHRQLGYCPQFDALIDMMTGRETLYMFARLRGVKDHLIADTVDRLTEDLLLKPHIDRLVKSYSGGNKRKLSTAVALIGDPEVIFLDEPSTGLDPVARRHLWNTLSRVCSSGRTLIFTSHSMEECEALCTQLAIMVNGRLKCLGSSQHLKSKFGDGYTVIAKVASRQSGDVLQLCRHIESTFPGSLLKDVHYGLVHYHVPKSPAVSLACLFASLEEIRERFSIDDYSVSQTTLEQVFLNFARTQRPPNDGQLSGCCRNITQCLKNCCCIS